MRTPAFVDKVKTKVKDNLDDRARQAVEYELEATVKAYNHLDCKDCLEYKYNQSKLGRLTSFGAIAFLLPTLLVNPIFFIPFVVLMFASVIIGIRSPPHLRGGDDEEPAQWTSGPQRVGGTYPSALLVGASTKDEPDEYREHTIERSSCCKRCELRPDCSGECKHYNCPDGDKLPLLDYDAAFDEDQEVVGEDFRRID
jgi:hypothetical protein